MVQIQNDGQRIVATNYFDSERAQCGLPFVSVHAGAVRVLVPNGKGALLEELPRIKWAEVAREGGRLVLWFDDGSSAPLRIEVGPEQFDWPPESRCLSGRCRVSVWLAGPRLARDLRGFVSVATEREIES